MPLFDFKCRQCGNEFETLVMGGAKPVCPRCQSEDLEKMMSSYACRRPKKGKGSSATGSGCAGCAGGSCATCH
ncbi:MAG: zinc ribbon domain-containing protein [Thermodesulfobacteriota bacterium]